MSDIFQHFLQNLRFYVRGSGVTSVVLGDTVSSISVRELVSSL